MFTISRQTEYALFLINALRDKESPVSLSEISRYSGLSHKFLAKTAVELKTAKILGSKEGVGGGYWLKANLNKLSLGKVISLFEHKRIVSCFSGKKRLSCAKCCRLKQFWKNLEREFSKQLDEINLAQMLS